jgi:hypothetical protein
LIISTAWATRHSSYATILAHQPCRHLVLRDAPPELAGRVAIGGRLLFEDARESRREDPITQA